MVNIYSTEKRYSERLLIERTANPVPNSGFVILTVTVVLTYRLWACYTTHFYILWDKNLAVSGRIGKFATQIAHSIHTPQISTQ